MEAKNPGQEIDVTSDTNFIQKVMSHLTVSGRLPFVVPADHIPLQVEQAAKYFYRKHPDAVETKYYALAPSGLTTEQLNRGFCLPYYVVAVTDLHQVNGNMEYAISRRSPSLIMLNALKFSEFVNGTYSGGGITNDNGRLYYSQQSYEPMDSVLSIYEASVMESFFKKTIRFDYNPNTNRMQVLGATNSNLVVEVEEGIELRHLYKDDMFLEYVVGLCLKNIKSVLGTFAFNMPGAITINYEEYETRGDKMIEKITAQIEDMEAGDLFIVS